MKFKFNQVGCIEILRSGKYQVVSCYVHMNDPCGDRCVFCGEPEYENESVHLSLCKKTLTCSKEDFTDERE